MMKHYIGLLALFALLFADVPAVAQRVAAPMLRSAWPQMAVPHPAPAAGTFRADTIWSDDFSDPSHWTTGTLGGTAHNWVIGTGGPSGEYAIGTILSATAANGFALFDSDLMCGPDNGYLAIASPVDLSGVPHVQLRFAQFYRRFQGQSFVDVSNDGTTWTSMEVNSQLITGAYTPNPEVASVDISAVAGNQPAVWFRFRYAGNCDYAWMVDDVALVEQPAQELVLVSASTTTWDFDTSLSFDSVYYSMFPVTELRPLAVNMTVFNAGYEPADNVMAHITTSDGYNASTNLGTIAPGDTITWFGPQWTPTSALGDHTIQFQVAGDQADEDTTNNAKDMEIQVTGGEDYIMARDNGAMQTVVGDGDQPFRVGNWYHFRNDHTAPRMQVVLGPGSGTQVEVNGQVLDANRDLLAETEYHTVLAEDLSNFGEAHVLDLWFDPPVSLQAGNDYFVAFQHFGGVAMEVGASGTSAEQSSLLYRGSEDTWYSISPTPMVRMVTDYIGGISEPGAVSVPLDIWPNPVQGITRMEFRLQRAMLAQLVLMDLRGRPVRTLASGHLSAGIHQLDLDTRGLAAGIYSVVLRTDAGRSVQRLVVMH